MLRPQKKYMFKLNQIYTHLSAITLKPLTGEVNNIRQQMNGQFSTLMCWEQEKWEAYGCEQL